MSFFDDIKNDLEEKAKSFSGDLTGFLKDSASEALVRIGPKPKGNLTPAEIESGEGGESPSVSIASGPNVLGGMNPLILIGAALALALLMKRGR